MLLRLLFLFPVFLLLFSCTVVEKKHPETPSIQETNELAAWNLSSNEQRITSSNRAVAQLLQQADDLMAKSNFEMSSDKLERLVRIEPQFAQAWSRLAWMALEKGDAHRSRQLAQRSNSYSRDNKKLKLLNWQFILKANELLNNIDIIQQAEQVIKTLYDELNDE